MQKIDCERQGDSKEKGSEELFINEFVKPNLTPEAIIGHGTFGYVFKAFDNNRNCTDKNWISLPRLLYDFCFKWVICVQWLLKGPIKLET